MKYKDIKIIKPVESFTYGTQYEELGYCKVKSGFTFNGENYKYDSLPELHISIFINAIQISFGLISNEQPKYTISFDNNCFSNEELISLSKMFYFNVIPNRYFPEKMQATLNFVDSDFKYINTIIKEHNNHFYILIYASKKTPPPRSMSEDFWGDNFYYIHGIWEIEISEPLKNRLVMF